MAAPVPRGGPQEQFEEELARQSELKEAELEQARKRTRRLTLLLAASFVAIAGFAALAFMTWQATLAAQRATAEANKSRAAAEAAKKLADDRLSTIETLNKGQAIRLAALSNDRQELARLLSGLANDTTIKFTAEAQDLKYKNPDGKEVYLFSLFPAPATLPRGKGAVAFVTYLAEHPTFKNTLLTAGIDRNYKVTYVGWGCLTSITAVIEYADHSRAPSVAEFNMCASVGFQ